MLFCWRLFRKGGVEKQNNIEIFVYLLLDVNKAKT